MNTKKELLAKIAELQSKVDAMPDDQPTGRILKNTPHEAPIFLTCVDGGTSRLNITGCYAEYVAQGRTFYDELSAKNFARYERLIQRMRQIAAQHPPCDWSDKKQKKYNLGYSFHTYKWREECFSGYKKIGTIYTSKRGALLEWVNSLSTSDQEILKWGEL